MARCPSVIGGLLWASTRVSPHASLVRARGPLKVGLLTASRARCGHAERTLRAPRLRRARACAIRWRSGPSVRWRPLRSRSPELEAEAPVGAGKTLDAQLRANRLTGKDLSLRYESGGSLRARHVQRLRLSALLPAPVQSFRSRSSGNLLTAFQERGRQYAGERGTSRS